MSTLRIRFGSKINYEGFIEDLYAMEAVAEIVPIEPGVVIEVKSEDDAVEDLANEWGSVERS